MTTRAPAVLKIRSEREASPGYKLGIQGARTTKGLSIVVKLGKVVFQQPEKVKSLPTMKMIK